MRMKKILIFFAAAATLVACQKTVEPQYVPGKEAIKFKTNLNYYTVKAAVDENVLSDVKVIAGDPIDQVASGTVEGTTMTVSPTLYWGVGQTKATKFVAITGGQTNIQVNEYKVVNPGGTYDYAYCAKLMSASGTATPGNEVSLSFEHIFSKLVINVDNKLGADVVSSVEVIGLANTAAIDFDAKTVTIDPADNYDSTFPAYEHTANAVYELALLPQTAAPTISVTTILGAQYTFVVDGTQQFEFQRGKVATVNITLSGATISGSSTQTPVGSFTINPVADWTEDTTAMPGEPMMGLSDNYWYIEGTVNGTSWGTAYSMTCTATDVWEADFTYQKGAADEGFKLHKTTGWGDAQLGADPDNRVFPADGTLTYGWKAGNENIQLAAAGKYHIKYDFTDGDKVYITTVTD